ncbi:MAG: hypothetical protein KGM47_18795, partial [Acidobacteriota bacterium]|nr:hypothetical protein [Acidobacteriota bacterium]
MRRHVSLRQGVIALLLFGVSFGFIEAAVVVYLRQLTQPEQAETELGRSSQALFPTLTMRQVQASPNLWRILKIELAREAATLIMLAAIAIAIGRSFTGSAGAFVAAFGVWDLSFYGFLKVFIHWPASLLTWDLLFLVPAPWSGPVLAPVIVSISMIFAGFFVLWSESRGKPLAPARLHWLGALIGGLIIILSFVWNYSTVLAGGVPRDFPWMIFGAGELLAMGTFFAAV